MRIVVASDRLKSAETLKQSLLQTKVCSDVHLLSLQDVADRSARFRPQAVIIYLPENPEKAIPVTREILEVTQTQVLVSGPAASAKTILQILKEGAAQYVDEEELEDQLPAALTRLGESSNGGHRLGRLVTVVGSGGGSGASTLAVNLAAGFAKAHDECALLDLSVTSGDLATILDVTPVHTLADLCRRVDRVDAKMFLQCLCSHPSGIQLLASPSSFRDFSAVTTRGIRKALGSARSAFDYVVVDLDCPFRPEQSKVLYYSDTILITMRLDFAAVRRTRELLAFFDELQLDRERMRIVATHYGSPKSLRRKAAEQALGYSIHYYVPHDPGRLNRSSNEGTPVVLAKPLASVSRHFLGICHQLNGKKTNHA